MSQKQKLTTVKVSTLETEIKSPLELPYIKILKSCLVIPGAWPSEVFGEKLPLPLRIHRVHMPFHSIIILLGGFYYLYDNYDELSFLYMGQVIITSFLAITSLVCMFRSALLNTKKFSLVLLKFMNTFHLMHFTRYGEFYTEMNEKVNKISYYYTNFSAAMMFLCLLMFNLGPAYSNLMNTIQSLNNSMQYSIYFSYPGLNPLDHFVSTSIYNCYLTFIGATLLGGFDLIMFLMIFQIIGHVLILRHRLENFTTPEKVINLYVNIKNNKTNCRFEIFDTSENESIRDKLAECIEYHKIIINFTDDLSALFGPLLAFNYLFQMISCCLLLLECSEGGMARFGPLTVIVFGQLIQMSVVFELLGAVTEKLKDSIYGAPWECMDVSNQRTVCFVLHKMQNKISLKALGLAAVGVNTMTAILKATFSYYAFLSTVGKD